MSMRFRILGSGSSGNSALLATEGTRVLIDAGFSARHLDKLLREAGESLATIDAVFLTHEHGDHTAGIEGLRRFPGIALYANAATARAVQSGMEHQGSWHLFETGESFPFKDLEVESFSVPHDAHDPVGFRFTHRNGAGASAVSRSLAWLTDLGHAPAHVHERLRECDVVVIEANHCPSLLEADTRRPWATKQRIRGRHGHLSNEAARDILTQVASPRWRRIYLTHLSRDCNSSEAIEAALAPARVLLGCEFSIVGPGQGTAYYDLH
jgi:phosphoribosyl 1,2-cyclic phosphodiesterase